jgi:hypothetical protein
MTPAQARSLLATFLGEQAAERFDPDWPETMLGLPPASTQREVIEAALNERLALIAAHPLGSSAAGIELSSVLRSVAGQMVQLYASATRAPDVDKPVDLLGSEPRTVEPAHEPPRAIAPTGLEDDAALLLSRHGRVNVEVIERLSELARQRGLSSDAVALTIERLSRGETRSVSPTITEPAPMPSAGGLGKVLLIAGAVGVLAVIAGLALLVIGGPSAPNAPATPASASKAPINTSAATTPSTTPAAEPVTPVPPVVGQPVPTLASATPDVQELLRDLRKAGETARDDAAGSQALFVSSWRAYKKWWPRFDTSFRQAMQDAASEYLYRVADDATRAGATLDELLPNGPLTGDRAPAIVAENLWPELMSGATLLRLVRERNLPPTVLTRVREASERSFGSERPPASASANIAMATVLRVTPSRFVAVLNGPTFATGSQSDRKAMVSDLERAFERYEQACVAGGGINLEPVAAERSAQSTILDAIEVLLRSAPDPVENEGTFALVSGAIGRQKFRPGDVSRQRLVAWLTDQRISASMLNVVTASMVTKAAPEGVDLSMVLAPNAEPSRRAELAEKLSQAWSLAGAGARAELSSEWTKAASVLINERVGSDLHALASAATLSRLSAAASLRWGGQGDAARSIITSCVPGAPALTGSASGAGSLAAARDGDGRWALQYLAVDRTVPQRLARLRELEAGGIPSQVDADVLLEVACTSANIELRAAAQKISLKQASAAPVLAALLKQLPRLPRNVTVGQFVEQMTSTRLGPISQEGWMLAARRATVEKLLEALAGASPTASSEQSVAMMSEAYRIGETQNAAPTSTGETPADELRGSAERLYRKLRLACEPHVPNARAPFSIDQVDARRAARRAVASGPIQLFAVEQLACVETLAYLVSGERPAAAADVNKVMGMLASERQKAGSIMDQLRSAEIASVRLWALRFGENLP